MEAKLITGGLYIVRVQVMCIETQQFQQSFWKCHLSAIEMPQSNRKIGEN